MGVNPLPGEPAFLLPDWTEEISKHLMCQSPYRGTGISTGGTALETVMSMAGVNPLTGEPAFLLDASLSLKRIE